MIERATFKNASGLTLHYETQGQGEPVLWQHGLGATLAQPAAVFPSGENFKRISLACRGHEDSDLGPENQLTIASFAQDAIDLLDHLKIEQAIIGGISLGAAIAQTIASVTPTRITKLILARPAWHDQDPIANQQIYELTAELLKAYGQIAGLAKLKAHPHFLHLAELSPDNAKSIESYFSRPKPETTIALLSAFSQVSLPGPLSDLAKLKVPTLIIANDQDPAHPLTLARGLAKTIPDAKLQIITSKSVDPAAYSSEFKACLAEFII